MDQAGCIVACTALRDAPDDASEQHTQVLLGDILVVHGRAGEWAEVTVPDGYRGFVGAAALGQPGGGAAHVVVDPGAPGRFLGSWLDQPADATEPLAQARAAGTGQAV